MHLETNLTSTKKIRDAGHVKSGSIIRSRISMNAKERNATVNNHLTREVL